MIRFRANITAMAGYTPGEQPRGGKIIKLNTNENPYPPSPAVALAISAAVEGGLARYPDPMGDAFRRRAGEVLGVPADWILCGNGSDDLLTILTRALVGEGERMRLPCPSYILYNTLAQIQGATSEEIHFNSDWSLDDNFSDPADDLRLAFLPNPNSPSGTLIPAERIAELAERLPCPLVIDEAYVDFADTNCIELIRQNERVMVLRTLSKSYALAGLRFGFLIAQPQVIALLTKVKDSYNCDALSIAGATAAIDDQAWLAKNRALVIATRDRMTAALRDLGFEVVDSQANFVWTTHPGQSAKSIYEQLRTEGVLVRYMNYEGWGDGLRISVGTDGQIDAMLEFLKVMV